MEMSFCISIVVDDDDEVDPLGTNIYTHINSKWNVHVNKLLKAPRDENHYDAITIRQLKMVQRIMLWLFSHVLRPKNGGFSRIDFIVEQNQDQMISLSRISYVFYQGL